MQPGQMSLNPLDPWLPLYAAGIAATVSLIVALINAWSARRLDTARAYREQVLRETGPSFVKLDEWYRRYLT
jgi:hypothetical protein